jgi:hypothetical protein
MFLKRTVDTVLENIEADTDIIVVMDGAWSDPPLEQNDRITVIHRPESIGQRAGTNEAARVSTAPYIMKLDAHCSVGKGFDKILLDSVKDVDDKTLQVPAQYNLHAFDWVCKKCGWKKYQGPTPKCDKCEDGGQVERKIYWQRRKSRLTTAWRFDKDLKFGYWGELKNRPEILAQGDITDTMSLLGACWFISQNRYWEIGGLDEGHGSWGQMGTELACKSWLSDGRVVCNHRTWFAHMFRTQGGDFGFPYKITNHDQNRARRYSKDIWLGDKWPIATKPLSWMIERFAPVPEWGDHGVRTDGPAHETGAVIEGQATGVPSVGESTVVPSGPTPRPDSTGTRPGVTLTKGVVYYTDSQKGNDTILNAARTQLVTATNGHEIISVSLKPLRFGDVQITMAKRSRGILSMFKQILAGLEVSTSDIIFLCEHDVLYHPSHFDFIPPEHDAFFYNENVWKVRAEDGQALFYRTKQTSGLCAYRDLLVEHYRRRVAKVEQNARDLREKGLPVRRDGYSRHMGFEPGCHAEPRGVDNYPAKDWMSPEPNLDIRHGHNLTPNRWSQDQFRDKKSCREWKMSDEVPGWGTTKGRFDEILANL